MSIVEYVKQSVILLTYLQHEKLNIMMYLYYYSKILMCEYISNKFICNHELDVQVWLKYVCPYVCIVQISITCCRVN